jgi:hypothetical protein
MNWTRRIIYLKDLEYSGLDSVKNDFTPIDSLIETFRRLVTDMLNLQWYFLNKGIGLNVILYADYKAEMTSENETILGLQIDIANCRLIINSRLGKEVLDYKEVDDEKHVDERIYQHTMPFFETIKK